MSEFDVARVEKYLNSRVEVVVKEHSDSLNTLQIGSKLVEVINAELPEKCPDVENFKYIVHATVQVSNIQ